MLCVWVRPTSLPISLVETLALSSQVVDDLEYPVDAVSFPEISSRDMARAQRNDEGTGSIISWLITKTKPNKTKYQVIEKQICYSENFPDCS